MAAPYIPSQDGALDTWASNFAALITASPTTYGLDALAAADIQAAADLYHSQYLIAGLTAPPNPTPVSPSTRTSVTIAMKDAAKLAGRQLWRTYAAQIRLNPGVMNSDKLALGLNLPNNTPSPIPEPVTWPILVFVSGGPLTHVLEYHDSTPGAGKAKPPGAVQLQLVGQAATAAATDPDALPIMPAQTKTPFQLLWPSPAGGKIATYAARWITRSGLTGPWSPLLSQIVLGV